MSANDPAKPTAPCWLYWVRALLFVAACGAGYLAWVSLRNGPVAGCGVGSGCNAVLQSRWAYWFNLPVSVPAVLVYLALIAATFLLRKSNGPDEERGAWAAIIVLAIVIAGSAFWFVSLQAFVIQSFCKYCLTAHTCGFLAAVICLLHIPFAQDPGTPMWRSGSGKSGVPRSAVFPLLLVGLIGVSLLAGGQLLTQKPRNVVKEVKPPAPAVSPAPVIVRQSADDVPSSPDARLVAPRSLSLYNGEFPIKLDALPVLGSPAATNVIVCLLDYTCIHCRALHPLLEQESRLFSNQLAIVCLPVSLSAACNPYISPANSSASSNSCDYARLSLAVWRAQPAVHQQFEDWLFDPAKPPPVDQARAYAAQLVGASQLNSALADPWVSAQLRFDCDLHRANWLAVDNAALPQIVMGDAVSAGAVVSLDHLQALLRQYLRLNLAAIAR